MHITGEEMEESKFDINMKMYAKKLDKKDFFGKVIDTTLEHNLLIEEILMDLTKRSVKSFLFKILCSTANIGFPNAICQYYITVLEGDLSVFFCS